MNALPDETYLIDCGRRIKLTSDREAHRLLDAACEAYRAVFVEHRRTGAIRNLTLTRFENAQRRLKNWLLGKEISKTEKAIRRGKQA